MEKFQGNLFESIGKLSYSYIEKYGYRLVVEVDQGISDFYRNLIPKYYKASSQFYKAHITVVRNEVPKNLDNWEKYQNQEIKFLYSNFINEGHVYWWLNCFSTKLEKIRTELGLEVSSQFTLPPEDFVKCFHCTIANKK